MASKALAREQQVELWPGSLCLRANGELSKSLHTEGGVQQGCQISNFVSNFVIDEIMRRTVGDRLVADECADDKKTRRKDFEWTDQSHFIFCPTRSAERGPRNLLFARLKKLEVRGAKNVNGVLAASFHPDFINV
ncbi:hypothetical protein CLF_112171 [Clonorchis sinensis]|uniref:Reverse transcriptase domain-containing protein n=1 Tax=Clonorchis sinensis TaxID=79923 RepID=G7YVX8_CLOSI|nr:hypothetical protein CLF_112171 [Clonorchis sinensis]